MTLLEHLREKTLKNRKRRTDSTISTIEVMLEEYSADGINSVTYHIEDGIDYDAVKEHFKNEGFIVHRVNDPSSKHNIQIAIPL